MLHCDAGRLALVALGEPLADDERSHLKQCAACQAELDQFTAVVAAGRQVTPEDAPSAPPAAVWSSIATQLGLGAEVTPSAQPAAEAQARVVDLAEIRHPDRGGRRRTIWIAAAASVAGIVLGALGASALNQRDASPGVLVAESDLTVVPVDAGGIEDVPDGVAGTARIVDTDGQDFAEVDTTGLPAIDGYYEVWLIRSDLSGMISLGALTSGAKGRFTIPEGTDLTLYTIVDVSVEPLDGDPVHSRQSVLRGTLPA